MIKELQTSLGRPCGSETPSTAATRSIKLDLPKFQGSDPNDWIFLAEEYFNFHEVGDDSRIQIAGFHMTKGALNWMRVVAAE